MFQIDANVDDMSPELCAPALDAVFAAGALDAWWTPIAMKKGRPALALSALAAGDVARDAVIAAILRETTTIGVRFAPRERVVLARRTVEVATRYGAIPIKLASDATGTVRNAAPEYDACAAAAARAGVPVKLVFAAALAAYDALSSARPGRDRRPRRDETPNARRSSSGSSARAASRCAAAAARPVGRACRRCSSSPAPTPPS